MVKPCSEHFQFSQKWTIFGRFVKTSTSNPFLCAADFFLQLASCKEAVSYPQAVHAVKYEIGSTICLSVVCEQVESLNVLFSNDIADSLSVDYL